MGNNPVGKKLNTLKGKYLGKYLFTFGIRFLIAINEDDGLLKSACFPWQTQHIIWA